MFYQSSETCKAKLSNVHVIILEVWASAQRLLLWLELTDGGDQSVGEEHGRCQVPVGRRRAVPQNRDAGLAGC